MTNKKNAGFSLVELIVVIAIMAVLVGVLAPAYLKYVEKSRKDSDVTAIDEMIRTAESVASDASFDDELAAGDTFTISGTDGVITVESAGNTNVTAEWQENAKVDDNGYNLKSKEFKAIDGTLTGTLGTNGTITWVPDSWDAADSLFGAVAAHNTAFSNKLSSSVAAD